MHIGETRPVDNVGMCAQCTHMRKVASERGSLFYQCALAAVRPEFAKYPRLPVLQCAGFQQADSQSHPTED